MSNTNKLAFAQITKVDEAKREVYGIATEEVPDSDDEMMDYDSSKSYFQDWANHTLEVTTGKSMGSVRYMHQLDACGKVIAMDFDDDNRRICVKAKIVDDSIWNKIVEGVLTGFSIGGRAVKKWKDAVNSAITRFTVKPIEVSVVDVPCLPTATYEYIKSDGSVESRTFKRGVVMDDKQVSEFADKLDRVWQEIQGLKKADGKTKRVAGEDLGPDAFAYVGDKNDTSTWKLPIKFSSEEKSKRHVRNALARFNQTQGIPEGEKAKVRAKIVAAAKKYGIEVSDEEKKAADEAEMIKTATEKQKLTKSLGSISEMVYVLQCLSYIKQDAEWEGMYEDGVGDDRDEAIAVELRALMDHAIEILKEIVDEETSELSAAVNKAQATEKEMKVKIEELLKSADSLRSHFKKAAAHHEKKMDLHKARQEYHTQKAAEHKAAGESGLEEMKVVHKSMADMHKTLADHHEEVSKTHKVMMDHSNKMSDSASEKIEDIDTLKAAAEEEEKKKAAAEAEKAAKKDGKDKDGDDDKKDPDQDADDEKKKAAKTSSGTTNDPGKENAMTDVEVKAEVTKAVQEAIAGLDLKKMISESIGEASKSLEDKMKEEIAKAAPAAAPIMPPVFAVPRVEKAAADYKPVKGDYDNGW